MFTAVFTLECIMKLMALSKEFFTNKWNVFDLVIVLASLLDLGLEIGSGLSVLRGMRLVSGERGTQTDRQTDIPKIER